MNVSQSTIFFPLQVIFEELQLHTRLSNSKLAKTAVGHQLSTSESVLTQLMHLHPLPAVILEYRQVCLPVLLNTENSFVIVNYR